MAKKILLTGGGTGGHVYPLLAVAESMKRIGREDIDLNYMGPRDKWSSEFSKRNIKTYKVTGAKLRRYFDLRNIIAIPKFLFSLVEAVIKMLFIMPDVVFSKGGPGSIAVVFAAKLYFIPVIIHESDSVPSLTTKITSKFAKRIGLSFKSALDYLPRSKCFVSGNPVREYLLENWLRPKQAKESLQFNGDEPLILVLGGSQGSVRMNSLFIDKIDEFIDDFQIYHQVGDKNEKDVKKRIQFKTNDWSQERRSRYKSTSYFEGKDLKYAFNAADIVVSRAGAGAIFEIAAFEKPSILVPLEGSAGDHQRINAREYSSTGAAVVIEENNFTVNIVKGQVKKILQSSKVYKQMSQAAKDFSKPKAANDIVREILKLS